LGSSPDLERLLSAADLLVLHIRSNKRAMDSFFARNALLRKNALKHQHIVKRASLTGGFEQHSEEGRAKLICTACVVKQAESIALMARLRKCLGVGGECEGVGLKTVSAHLLPDGGGVLSALSAHELGEPGDSGRAVGARQRVRPRNAEATR
jgi:hypothetical protein